LSSINQTLGDYIFVVCQCTYVNEIVYDIESLRLLI